MLIPQYTLARLSPTAAKIYLTLLNLADLRQSPPAATLSITSLTRHALLSERTCNYALRQLRALKLIQSHRRGKNAPSTYQLPHLTSKLRTQNSELPHHALLFQKLLAQLATAHSTNDQED